MSVLRLNGVGNIGKIRENDVKEELKVEVV